MLAAGCDLLTIQQLLGFQPLKEVMQNLALQISQYGSQSYPESWNVVVTVSQGIALQVGYGKKHGPGVSTRRRAADNAKSNLVADSNAVEKLAKQRLAEAMRSSTRQGASGEDALKLVLGIAE